MQKFLFLLILIVVVFFVGCSSSNVVGKVSNQPVATQGNRSQPDWVSADKVYWTEKNKMFFRVFVSDEPDLDLAEIALTAKVAQELVQRIKIRVGLEFDVATKGSKYNAQSSGNARQAVVNAAGDAVFNYGKENSYWEKFEKNEVNNNVSYFYTLNQVYSIDEADYLAAKAKAWNVAEQVVEREADKEAKLLLNETKVRFLNNK